MPRKVVITPKQAACIKALVAVALERLDDIKDDRSIRGDKIKRLVKSRQTEIVQLRRMIVFITHKTTGMIYSHIGRHLGYRDTQTIRGIYRSAELQIGRRNGAFIADVLDLARDAGIDLTINMDEFPSDPD